MDDGGWDFLNQEAEGSGDDDEEEEGAQPSHFQTQVVLTQLAGCRALSMASGPRPVPCAVCLVPCKCLADRR